ncbi:FAD-dependent oxidoreductase [Celeribacter baekdonensis]|uniref:FAD-dependent oxidoreductase n=1 Tax=Celeribacter baekdonensis TaxID=875171 RepID=UPI0030DAC1C8
MANKQTADVLIVGAGPTGSTLGVDLARRGVKVRIIDRNPQSFPGSRAKGIQPRSMEVLEDLGAIEDILSAGSIYPPLGIHIGPIRVPKKMMKIASATDAVPYPNTWLIPQFSTDAIIQRQLAPWGVQVEHNTQLVSLTQDDAGVTAIIDGPDGAVTERFQYVVGADGGSSKVRQQLDIAFPGKTDESDRMIIVDCKVEGLGRNHWHVWPWLKGAFAGACPLPNSDLFQVMIRLKPGEEPKLDAASLNTRWAKQTGSSRFRLYDIQWTTVFRPNIRLAEHYGRGRVFLAGDAAHVHTPMGAQGMNTGIQDAYNLGWKLGQVLAGAPADLLNSYEDERQPIAAGVLGVSTAKYEALGKLDPSAISRGKDEQQLSITYRAGPLGALEQEGSDKLRPGDRAPDARLQDTTGKPTRLFEALRGPHFTLLAYGPGAAADLAAVAWAGQGAPLKRVAIDAGPGAFSDLCLADAAGSFREGYGVDQSVLLLIRPDGYIATFAVHDRVATIENFAARVTAQA